MAEKKLIRSFDGYFDGYTFEQCLSAGRFCGACLVEFDKDEYCAPFGGFDICEGCIQDYSRELAETGDSMILVNARRRHMGVY